MSRKTQARKAAQLNDNADYGIYTCLENKELHFPYGKIDFKNGETLLMPNNLPINKRKVKSIYDAFKPLSENDDLNNKRILVVRYGGAGDILCTIPALYELKQKFPKCTIGFVGSPSYITVLKSFDGIIDGISNVISTYEKIKDFDYIAVLDNVVERFGHLMPIQQLFASQLHVTIKPDTMNNLLKRNKLIKDMKSRSGIGIQYSSNAALRNYDIDNLIHIINQLNNEFKDEIIHLLGSPDDYLSVNYIQSRTNGKVFSNGCGMTKMNLEDTFDMISNLKLVIAPDSSMLHFAGFNNTPAVGLFGPFPSSFRIGMYNNMIGIDGQAECTPCMRHNPVSWCPFNSGEGKCINDIHPDIVFQNAVNLLNLYKEETV